MSITCFGLCPVPTFKITQEILPSRHHHLLLTFVFGKFEVRRNFEPLWMKLEITLSMSPVFKCCDIIIINFIISYQIVHLQCMSRKDDVKLPNRICDNIVHLGDNVSMLTGSFSISNLKFPRLCAKLFLVTLNIAWDYVVPGEDHICPKNEDDP